MKKIDLYKKTMDAITNGILITDPNQKDNPIIYSNEGFQRLTGYSNTEILGHNCRFLQGPDTDPVAIKNIHKAITAGKSCHAILKNYRKDGNWFWNELQISPVYANNKLLYFIGIQTDVTSRIETATALKESKEELEYRVDQRTRELLQANLRLKKDAKEKEVLLKEVHHRVKNNLQIISSLLGLQLEHIKSPDDYNMLLDCNNRIKVIALMHEMLYQTKDIVSINAAEYLEMLKNYLANIYQKDLNRVQIQFNIEPILLELDNAIYLGLIINELTSNAFQHAFPEMMQGEITVNLHKHETGKLLLVIYDNGIVLPSGRELEQKKSLGLELVDIFVGQMGGTMAIERDGGTKFIINLPANQ